MCKVVLQARQWGLERCKIPLQGLQRHLEACKVALQGQQWGRERCKTPLQGLQRHLEACKAALQGRQRGLERREASSRINNLSAPHPNG